MALNPTLSVAVPTHSMKDGDKFLTRLLESLWTQTFQDFEIVITDNSDDDMVKNIAEYYKTGIKYFKNPIKGMAQNTNEVIRKSEGEIVKILYMDDYLLRNEVLEDVVDNLMGKKKGWLIQGADNNPDPKWTDDIYTGNNKLGSPSALAFVNRNPLFFDEELTWLLDCDLYKRYYEREGEPIILSGKHIGIGVGDHQMTNLIPPERKLAEHEYLMNKNV